MKKILAAIAVIVSLGVGYLVAQTEPFAWLGRINWTTAGVTAFIEAINSSGQKVTYANTAGANAQVIDDDTGGTALRMLTSAQMSTLTPPASGYLYINITTGQLGISSAATQGAIISISTSPNFTKIPAY